MPANGGGGGGPAAQPQMRGLTREELTKLCHEIASDTVRMGLIIAFAVFVMIMIISSSPAVTYPQLTATTAIQVGVSCDFLIYNSIAAKCRLV